MRESCNSSFRIRAQEDANRQRHDTIKLSASKFTKKLEANKNRFDSKSRGYSGHIQELKFVPSRVRKSRRPSREKRVQIVADELRSGSQPAWETYNKCNTPSATSDNSSAEDVGVRRSSRQTKKKEPKRSGDPVKQSVREVSEDKLTGADH